MVDICDFAVGLSRQLYGRTMPSERPGHRLMETWHPLGVVGVISAFNFPVAVWSWNTAVALVCGDTVVWKPSELTPLTALACSALLDRAAADVGRAGRASASSCSATRPVAERLVDNPLVPLVSATGSVRMGRGRRAAGGRAVRPEPARARRQQRHRRRAVGRPRPRGARHRVRRGRDRGPAVHDAAPADRARERRRPLLDKVVAAYRRLPVGNPFDAGDAGRAAGQREAFAALQAALDDVRADGGEVLVGGDRQLADAGAGRLLRRARSGAGGARRATSYAGRRSRRCCTSSPTATSTRRSRCRTPCRRGCRRRSSPGDQAEAERFMAADGADCGIVNVNIGTSRRRDRRCVRRPEGDRRRPRVRLGLVEGLHAPRDEHGQLQRRAAAGPGRRLHRVSRPSGRGSWRCRGDMRTLTNGSQAGWTLRRRGSVGDWWSSWHRPRLCCSPRGRRRAGRCDGRRRGCCS